MNTLGLTRGGLVTAALTSLLDWPDNSLAFSQGHHTTTPHLTVSHSTLGLELCLDYRHPQPSTTMSL